MFVRISELIETPGDELRLRIDPDKTDHYVFSPRQLMPMLEQLQGLTGQGRLVFPNERDPEKPMSYNTMLKALERMGYKGDMTGHGFRTLA